MLRGFITLIRCKDQTAHKAVIPWLFLQSLGVFRNATIKLLKFLMDQRMLTEFGLLSQSGNLVGDGQTAQASQLPHLTVTF